MTAPRRNLRPDLKALLGASDEKRIAFIRLDHVTAFGKAQQVVAFIEETVRRHRQQRVTAQVLALTPTRSWTHFCVTIARAPRESRLASAVPDLVQAPVPIGRRRRSPREQAPYAAQSFAVSMTTPCGRTEASYPVW